MGILQTLREILGNLKLRKPRRKLAQNAATNLFIFQENLTYGFFQNNMYVTAAATLGL
ncbi:MAG: hypothetical protein V3T10_03175 [Candidatus Bathyarchaeia archaeon]